MRNLLLAIALCLCTGCVVAPVIDAYNQLGLSKVDREKLLPKQVNAFQDHIHWGTPNESLQYVRVDKREKVGEQLEKGYEGVRVVESKVQSIQYNDASDVADVTLKVKYFKVPFYVVTDRVEKQHWEFSLSDGWQYISGTILPAG